MPRTLKTSWTDNQIARLKELAAAGASPIKVAAAVNRPIATVRAKARELGIELRTIGEIRAKMRKAESEARKSGLLS